jgi:hypothetical protein
LLTPYVPTGITGYDDDDEIYMGPPGLLPLQRKACWGIFRPEKSDNGFGRV